MAPTVTSCTSHDPAGPPPAERAGEAGDQAGHLLSGIRGSACSVYLAFRVRRRGVLRCSAERRRDALRRRPVREEAGSPSLAAGSRRCAPVSMASMRRCSSSRSSVRSVRCALAMSDEPTLKLSQRHLAGCAQRKGRKDVDFIRHCCIKRSRDHSTGISLVRARPVTARHAVWPLSCPCDSCRVNVGRKIYGLMIR